LVEIGYNIIEIDGSNSKKLANEISYKLKVIKNELGNEFKYEKNYSKRNSVIIWLCNLCANNLPVDLSLQLLL